MDNDSTTIAATKLIIALSVTFDYQLLALSTRFYNDCRLPRTWPQHTSTYNWQRWWEHLVDESLLQHQRRCCHLSSVIAVRNFLQTRHRLGSPTESFIHLPHAATKRHKPCLLKRCRYVAWPSAAYIMRNQRAPESTGKGDSISSSNLAIIEKTPLVRFTVGRKSSPNDIHA